LMWFILGCCIGLILYLTYKKLKGGNIKWVKWVIQLR
jgi:hypothetical protein